MLEHLGEVKAATAIMRAIESVLNDETAPRTADMGGTATTQEMGDEIMARLT